MATIHDFKEAQSKARSKAHVPKVVTFYSAQFRKAIDGIEQNHTACVNVFVKDGDAAGLIEAVMANCGVWNEEGRYFVPWPCAFVEIRDWDGIPMESGTMIVKSP